MLMKYTKKPLFWLYGVGIILLLSAGYIWCYRVNTNPERVFWGMINQSMKTSGVTVKATQSNSSTTYQQTIQFSLGGQNYTHSLVTLTQPGTTVQDEMIGTPKVDYMRYSDIKTDQKNSSGKPLDLSKVVGVWAKTDNDSYGSQLISQSVLGLGLPLGGVAVPIADLSPELRGKLMQQIKNDKVYEVSFKNVKKTHKNGRLLYTYSTTSKSSQYASMMKTFGKSVGIKSLDNLNPQDYASEPDIEMSMTVDVRAHQLVSAEVKSANIKQTYSSYDVPVSVELPKKTITGAELQKRLQEL